MRLELPLSRAQWWWTRAVHRVTVATHTVTSLVHGTTAAGQTSVRPRHYPPRSCSYLDNDLMEREMYDHARDKPTNKISRP